MLDASTPDSVGPVCERRGREVIYHREVLEDGTPDHVVCATAIANEAVLVAVDADMERLTKRWGSTPETARFKHLSLIRVGCNGPMASKRVDQAMDLIELEWSYSQGKVARRLWVDVSAHFIKTHR